MANNNDENKEEKLDLFSKVKLGKYELSNRIAMAPMTRGRATPEWVPTEIMIKYYASRADCGLIITEGTGICQQGIGWYQAPGIWTDEMVEKWKLVTDEVHKNGGIISLQLWHLGRQGSHVVTGMQSVSASAIALEGQNTGKKGVKHDRDVPKAMNEKEIETVIKDYGHSASNAMKAGFDLVELHSANGYLIDQFLQKPSNIREDKYGGSIENRIRFMQEAVTSVIKSVGDSSKVGIRLSPNGNYGGMGGDDNLELFDAAIEWLSQQKLGYIHVMDGLGFGFHKKTKEPYTLQRAKGIINKYNKDIVLIGNVGYTKETGNEQIGKGNTEMIAYGRPYLSNPDLVTRFKNDIKLADVPPHEVWWGWDKYEKGYIDFPTAEEEKANGGGDDSTAANDAKNGAADAST